MSVQEFLAEDFAAFEDWRAWPPSTLACYIACMLSRYERERFMTKEPG